MCGHNGSFVEARALLDCASSALFISEKLATGLNLQRTKQHAVISGIAGVHPEIKPTTNYLVCHLSISSKYKKFNVTAMIVPCVTSDLPLVPIPHDQGWQHFECLAPS